MATDDYNWGDYFTFSVRDSYAGNCCMNCMKYPTSKKPLLQCGSCKMVKYCSRTCQIEHWKKTHKQQCKLVKEFKDEYDNIPGFTLFSKCQYKQRVAKNTFKELSQYEAQSKDAWVSDIMQNFIMSGKRCLICNVNQYSCGDTQPKWVCCSKCNAGWCCSEEHWKKYKHKHTPKICHSYKQSTAMELFNWHHVKNHNDDFRGFPDTTMSSPVKSFFSSWDEYFTHRFKEMYIIGHKQGCVPSEFFPCTTRVLTQAVTALYGMYEHGIEMFENKSTLTLDIVGANHSFECLTIEEWQEIMHCLPNITTLTTVFIGPEADVSGRNMMNEITCCPTCQQNNRSRFYGIYSSTYHEHYNEFKTEPDFIVAYNTGLFEEYTESWKESIKVMLDMNVPCFFTSYDAKEAKADVDVVKSLGANMLYKDGARNNPFKDLQPRLALDKFFHCNMYCYGFRGYS